MKRILLPLARIVMSSCLISAMSWMACQVPASAQSTPNGSRSARPQITDAIDQGKLVSLPGHVRKDLTPERDLGEVEDSQPIRLLLVLQRTPEQQAALTNLIARQQQRGTPEYHKWLTPQEFGEQFGIAQSDVQQVTTWLQSQGFKVNRVFNNASMIDFTTTAGGVRNAFHTQYHYWNIQGSKYLAVSQDPQIPAALAKVVVGVKGLSRIPPQSKRTNGHQVGYDTETHRWRDVISISEAGGKPNYTDGAGNFDVTPQDFYTIYDVNPLIGGGNLGAGATISIPEPTDMQFGTVNASTGAASGGDVVTFRTLFGVGGTLNMTVMHGAGSVTCGDPGVNGAVGEAALDAEWANAVAPSAHLIFMSCDTSGPTGDGFGDALAALIDNNISDVISSSYGTSELNLTSSDYATQDTLTMQAATQGQTFIDAAGDAGSDDADQNTTGSATHGLNVDSYAGTPLTLVTGGTDFQDKFDADQGGLPQSTYWSSTNSSTYGDALGYIPETPWNSSCADSIIALDSIQNGSGSYTGAGYCALGPSIAPINGAIVGGGGGFSSHYSLPLYQSGTPGISSNASKRAVPDISFFAANGYWGHDIIQCDSTEAATACTSPSTFEGAGGTSFTAPQTAGIIALLVTATGERQGFVNPGIYALAKSQYAASATASACYSNGQTSNTGVTTSLPAAACIFHDVTTGNNDEPCAAGTLDCYVNPGAGYGMLSTTGASSLTVGFPSGPTYDNATGLGSLDVNNFIKSWNQANSSSTSLAANPTSITSTQSTTLTATVTPGTPPGATGATPSLSGSVSFFAGSTLLGSCTLSGGTCSLPVSGSLLQSGPNSVTASYKGSATYPSSTSSIVTVTVTGGTISTTTTVGATANPQELGEVVHFVVKVVASGVNPVTNEEVTLTIDGGTPYEASLDSTGHAQFGFNTLTLGVHTIAAAFPAQGSYGPSSATLQETISDSPASIATVSGSGLSTPYGLEFTEPLVAVVKDSNGHPVPGAVVSFSGAGLRFSSTAATTDNNGQATVRVFPAAAGNFTASATVGGVATAASFTLIGTKASLLVKANNISVAFDQPVPAPTYSLSGFVNGDTAATAVTGSALISTPARQGSSPGTYGIGLVQGTLSASNYNFELEQGTVTINP